MSLQRRGANKYKARRDCYVCFHPKKIVQLRSVACHLNPGRQARRRRSRQASKHIHLLLRLKHYNTTRTAGYTLMNIHLFNIFKLFGTAPHLLPATVALPTLLYYSSFAQNCIILLAKNNTLAEPLVCCNIIYCLSLKFLRCWNSYCCFSVYIRVTDGNYFAHTRVWWFLKRMMTFL